jgi:hypothetical protein
MLTQLVRESRKASFLGDSDFPNAVGKDVKGVRIELFQGLYERYSRLALSFPSDRPIAIKGLETRLLDTFRTAGGYGVFDIYFHRCLLWQRAGDAPLKHIKPFRGSSPVPSWSWMAYDGPIRYLAVPFGQALWCDNITSPFTRASQLDVLHDSQRGAKGIDVSRLELEAPVCEIHHTQGGQVILDDSNYAFSQPLHCVVIGTSKTEPLQCYVLLVHVAASVDKDQVYERIGVAVLDKSRIIQDGRHGKARIR